MKSLKDFTIVALNDIISIRGGVTPTDGGRYNKNGYSFYYDSDSTTWEPNSMEWKVNYYGIRTCAC